MIAVEVLMDKLNGFETCQEVADFLTSQQIKGDATHAHTCVISNWITRESGADYTITTGVVTTGQRGEKSAPYHMSNVAQSFIARFDSGHYPELENETSQAEY